MKELARCKKCENDCKLTSDTNAQLISCLRYKPRRAVRLIRGDLKDTLPKP
jgi:hypothetical protein